MGALIALRGVCLRIGRLARLAATVLIATLCLAAPPAEAHHYRHHRHAAHSRSYARHHHSARHRGFARRRSFSHWAHHWRHARYAHRVHPRFIREARAGIPASPAFSAIVVDANTGKTLYSAHENGLRHPASITKVMTLYLLFEELDRGALTLNSRIPISEHAAAQEPTKLGLPPGDTISVNDAIKAVVTRSANDIAVAIAEAIGGTEDNFAAMMTRKARELGMMSTVYRNATGLPNDGQVTTARDLAVLGLAMEDRFPRYFHYFSLPAFTYDREIIRNHDHLLGRVAGVDGIKTGYIRASGFNLLTSVHRGGRSLIAVVIGGRTAAGRDRIMENLIADHFAEASTVRTATAVASASPAEPRAAPPTPPHPVPVGEAALQRVSFESDAQPGISEGGRAAGDDQGPARRSRSRARPPAPDSRAALLAEASALIMPPERPQGLDAGRHRRAEAETPAEGEERDASAADGGWMIQIGAADSPARANALLTRARERNRATLASARPLTEKVRKGDATFYRARFAMMDSETAEAACRSLKRNGFSCFPAR